MNYGQFTIKYEICPECNRRIRFTIHASRNTRYAIRAVDLYNCRGFSTNRPFYAKQTQSQVRPNQRKFFYNKQICESGHLVKSEKQTQSNPIFSAAGGLQMNLKLCKKMTYENNFNWTLGENKPKQSQSLIKDLIALVKNSCAPCRPLLQCFPENFNKPGERKAECSVQPKLRDYPMNLLGIMPAKEGKIDLKHSFYGSAFCFGTEHRNRVIYAFYGIHGQERERK